MDQGAIDNFVSRSSLTVGHYYYGHVTILSADVTLALHIKFLYWYSKDNGFEKQPRRLIPTGGH